jgi:competence ComEA-like helix-hairpin-helix protein
MDNNKENHVTVDGPLTETLADNLTPEEPPQQIRSFPEKLETGLVILLSLLIIMGNLVPHVLPARNDHPLEFTSDPMEAQKFWESSTAQASNETVKIAINSAGLAELVALPGIGPSLAQAILTYRSKNGDFHLLQDLENVPGIGPAKLTMLADWVSDITYEQENLPTSSELVPATDTNSVTTVMNLPQNPSSSRINLNQATLEDLLTLSGIGKTYAQRILEKRQSLGRFTSWQQIDEIEGIGERRLENIRSLATID